MKKPVQIYCSEVQHDRWCEMAARSAMSLSEWIRHTLDRGDAIRAHVSTTYTVTIESKEST